MCRNHRGFIESVVACSKLGANVLFLNTAFSGPQLTDVAQREQPKALIYDYEFEELIHDASRRRKRFIAWHDADDGKPKRPAARGPGRRAATSPPVSPPSERGKAIILTSGTTGTPKGASRSQPKSLDPAAALLAMIPLKAREKTMIAAPMFHSWGFVHFTLGMSLSSTLVLKRKFDPEGDAVADRPARGDRADRGAGDDAADPRAAGGDAQAVRPVEGARRRRLRLGAAGRAVRALDGPVRRQRLQPLRLDRGGVGEHRHARGPARRARHRRPAAARHDRAALRRRRQAGRRRARPAASSSATRCSSRATPAAAARTTSTACSRPATSATSTRPGRLFVDGRDDDMIVSGGENVFPAEVEDLLSGHDAIVEVAVFGVDDEEFGQRLKAVVVLRDGASRRREKDIKEHVKSNLAGYKVPRDVEFVDELPRTSTGKVLKRELRDSYGSQPEAADELLERGGRVGQRAGGDGDLLRRGRRLLRRRRDLLARRRRLLGDDRDLGHVVLHALRERRRPARSRP